MFYKIKLVENLIIPAEKIRFNYKEYKYEVLKIINSKERNWEENSFFIKIFNTKIIEENEVFLNGDIFQKISYEAYIYNIEKEDLLVCKIEKKKEIFNEVFLNLGIFKMVAKVNKKEDYFKIKEEEVYKIKIVSVINKDNFYIPVVNIL